MAVLIEAYSVVVRHHTLTAKYPGGVAGYRADAPNRTYCADEHLSRIGFMAFDDAAEFVAGLSAAGLVPERDGTAEDVAVVSQQDGPTAPCDWLAFGEIDGAIAAWRVGAERGQLRAPEGWTPARALRYVSRAEAARQLEFLRTEGEVDVYRDMATGQVVYVGRTGSG